MRATFEATTTGNDNPDMSLVEDTRQAEQTLLPEIRTNVKAWSTAQGAYANFAKNAATKVADGVVGRREPVS